MKQVLKLTLVTLTPLAAPPAGSTRPISNTLARLCIASVTFKAFAANKRKKPFAPPPLGLPKPS